MYTSIIPKIMPSIKAEIVVTGTAILGSYECPVDGYTFESPKIPLSIRA